MSFCLQVVVATFTTKTSTTWTRKGKEALMIQKGMYILQRERVVAIINILSRKIIIQRPLALDLFRRWS